MCDKRKVRYNISLSIEIDFPFEGFENLKSGTELASDIVEMICGECAMTEGKAHCIILDTNFRIHPEEQRDIKDTKFYRVLKGYDTNVENT